MHVPVCACVYGLHAYVCVCICLSVVCPWYQYVCVSLVCLYVSKHLGLHVFLRCAHTMCVHIPVSVYLCVFRYLCAYMSMVYGVGVHPVLCVCQRCVHVCMRHGWVCTAVSVYV